MAKNLLELKVKFTKIGNKIKCQLPVKMFCEEMNSEIPNSMTLDKTDGIILSWFSDVDKSFKSQKVIFKKVNLSLVYDKCDKPKSK